MLLKFNCNTLGWKTVLSYQYLYSVGLCVELSIPSVFICSCARCMVPFPTWLCYTCYFLHTGRN